MCFSSISKEPEEDRNQNSHAATIPAEFHPSQDQNADANSHTQDQDREFWETPCEFTPESRLEAHRHLEEKRKAKERQRYTTKNMKIHRFSFCYYQITI